MPRPYFTAKHVESMSLLPENLEVGRAYFVDDEQVIVIDHGRGPVIYGGATGPQGIAGEPIPQLQEQIDKLVDASLTQSKTIWDINTREVAEAKSTAERFSNLQAHFTQSLADTEQRLETLISSESENRHTEIAALQEEITTAINDQAERFDSALNILAKSIANLYPEHYAPEDSQDDPLDNETIYTDSGAYTIQQTILKDGTVVLNLTPQEQVIDSLKAGDSVDFDGSTWIVEEITNSDGVTSITIRP